MWLSTRMPGSLRVGSQRTSRMSPNESVVSSRSHAAPVPSNNLAIVSSTRLTPGALRDGLSISTMLRMSSRIASLSTRSSRKEGMVGPCGLQRRTHRLHENSAVLEYCQKIDSYFLPGICHLGRWICALLHYETGRAASRAAGQI